MAPLTLKYLPENETGEFSISIILIIFILSSSISTLADAFRKLNPWASNSLLYQPALKPNSTRPLLVISSVETILASSDGGVLYELTRIAPSRILCVIGASEESVVQHSSTTSLSVSQVATVFLPFLTYDWSQGRKSSFNHIESNPRLSHSLTVDTISSNLCPSW